MPGITNPVGSCRAIERRVNASWSGPPVAGGSRLIRKPDGRRVELTVELDRAVVITCRAPRNAGAGAALALADEVSALLRGLALGSLRFGTPSIDLDGRDPDGFRAVVTVPIRRQDTARPSRPTAAAARASGR